MDSIIQRTSTSMNQNQKDNLRNSQVEIADDLEPKDILDNLYEDGILSENDCERISETKTRKERCQLLFSMLPTRGPTAYGSFKKALSISYTHLETKLKDHEENESNKSARQKQEKPCKKCCPFLPENLRAASFVSILLNRHCCLLYDAIDPVDLLDLLYQERLLTDDDSERVRSGVTRRDRCKVFFSALLKNESNDAFGVFKQSLVKKYSFVLELLGDINVFTNEHIQSKQEIEQREQRLGQRASESGQITQEFGLEASTLQNRALESGLSALELGYTAPKLRQGASGFGHRAPGLGHTTLGLRHKAIGDLQIENSNIGFVVDKGDSCPLLYTSSFDLEKTSKEPFISKNQAHDDMYTSNSDSTKTRQKYHPPRKETEGATLNVVHVNPVSLQSRRTQNMKLQVAFNYLSTMINQGSYDEFENFTLQLRLKFPNNYDMSCMLSYLQASKCLFTTDTETAKNHIHTALSIVPKTSNPKYFLVELLTAKTRQYLAEKRYGKLQEKLDDVKMIIGADPLGCTGRAAGWIYMNDAKQKTSQMMLLNLDRPKSFEIYRKMYKDAKNSIHLALSHFQQDSGKDGPFGIGYGLCRLVVLLLQCGNDGLTMGTLYPSKEDIEVAKGYLDELENLNIIIPKILNVHFLLAKSDYQYRIKNTTRALQHAESAYELSQEVNILEFDFKEHLQNRIAFLKLKSPIEIEEINDFNILFGSSESDDKITEESDSV